MRTCSGSQSHAPNSSQPARILTDCSAKKAAAKWVAAKPTLLAGGNPQIAKADGDAPVLAYIAAMSGWKRDVGRRLDALNDSRRTRTLQASRRAICSMAPL